MVDFLGGDPSELIFDLNSEFAGETMTDVMHLLIVTSFFAGCLALHNACSRYPTGHGPCANLARGSGEGVTDDWYAQRRRNWFRAFWCSSRSQDLR